MDKNDTTQPSYRCVECEGTSLQIAAWVDANTREVSDDYGSWNNTDTQWCNDCDAHVAFEIAPTGGAK